MIVELKDRLKLLRTETITRKAQDNDINIKDESYKIQLAAWSLALISIMASVLIIIKKK
mgnify:FL=1|tara:strand:- start:274 stop:450 length:177 start_codon:yes stop_codon:yes gene_type:complete